MINDPLKYIKFAKEHLSKIDELSQECEKKFKLVYYMLLAAFSIISLTFFLTVHFHNIWYSLLYINVIILLVVGKKIGDKVTEYHKNTLVKIMEDFHNYND